jgi:hypothetical protein
MVSEHRKPAERIVARPLFWQYGGATVPKEKHMRRAALLSAALVLSCSTTVLAQEWTQYVNRQDRFSVNAPGQPVVTTMTWPSEYGATMPARVYTWQTGSGKYVATVVDYTESRKRHLEAQQTQANQQGPPAIYADIDVLGSVQYAATRLFRQKPGTKVTYDAWHYIDLIPGHQLQLTNADASRTFVGIYLHESRLYVLEGTVPKGSPPPGLFQQSISFLNADGQRMRYDDIYVNRFPPRPGRGGQE